MNLPPVKQSVLCVIMALSAGQVLAAPGWDCQRGAAGKEWVCVSGNNKPAQPAGGQSGPSAPVEKPSPKSAEIPQPPAEAPSSPVERTAEPRPPTAPVAKPSPKSAEIPQPPAEAPSSPVERTAEPRPPTAPVAKPSPKSAEIPQPPAEAPSSPVEREAEPRPPIPAPARQSEAQVQTGASGPVGQPKPIEPAHKAVPTPPPQPVATESVRPPIRAEQTKPLPVPKVATPTPSALVPEVVQNQSKSGWNCKPGDGKEWDCALSGSDPRGEAHVVGNGGQARPNWADSSDMTSEDERRFSAILNRLPANPWALSCGKNRIEWRPSAEFLLSDADRILREKSPLQITSDQAEIVQGETSSYQGGAELVRADQQLYGNFVTYNNKSSALNAQGEVVYREKGLSFASDTAFMKMDSDEGVLRNSQFIVETLPARGTSRITHIDSKKRSRYENATYTTCPPGNQDWLLHADNVLIDKESGQGIAKRAWLQFKGVPFFYTPVMSFPVDNRRKTGFMSPNIGYSKLNGLDFSLNYYINLAPNYDLTLIPRYLLNRGGMLRADFRYMSEIGAGRLFGDIVPYDQLEKETRGQVGWADKSRWTDKFSTQVDLHLVSDSLYIQQLGNLLAINNTTYLRSFGTANYAGGTLWGGSYSANVMADFYQSLNKTIKQSDYPYRRMPQINLAYSRPVGDTGLQFQSTVEMTRFDQPNKVNGERMNLRPRLYYPFRDPGGYVTPSLTLQHTEYWLQNTGITEASSFSRTAPIFSVDSGAFFENDFTMFDSPMQQTLEPRLFYLFVPKVNQPYHYNFGPGIVVNPMTGPSAVGYQGLNFDSNEFDFNYYQLFRENRFAGVDRLSDANNITPALTTRLISQDSGLERLRMSVGKVFYLTNPSVVMTLNGPQPTYKNNIVQEVASKLSQNWAFSETGQWNHQYNRLDRLQLGLQYNNFSNNLLNLFYRYRRDPYEGSTVPYPVNPYNPRTINQTDINARLPVWGGWYAIGRWQYSLESKITVEALAGVEKETCCWRFSLVGLRYQNGATTSVATSNSISTNQAIYFQFELKGLGNFGDQIDNLLLQNFSGYRTDYELPGLYTQSQQAYN